MWLMDPIELIFLRPIDQLVAAEAQQGRGPGLIAIGSLECLNDKTPF